MVAALTIFGRVQNLRPSGEEAMGIISGNGGAKRSAGKVSRPDLAIRLPR